MVKSNSFGGHFEKRPLQKNLIKIWDWHQNFFNVLDMYNNKIIGDTVQ